MTGPRGCEMRCQIRVRGHLDPAWRHRLAGFQITHEDAGVSLLSGPLTDQAALHGLLLQIVNLGLPLLSLEMSEAPRQEEAGEEGGAGGAQEAAAGRSQAGVPWSDGEMSAAGSPMVPRAGSASRKGGCPTATTPGPPEAQRHGARLRAPSRTTERSTTMSIDTSADGTPIAFERAGQGQLARAIAPAHAHAPGASLATATRRTRAQLAGGVAAGPLFALVAGAQVLTRDGFDLRRHPLSLLSTGDLGWLQIGNFVATGLLTVACAAGMRRALHPGRGGTWGPLLVGAFGAGLVAGGVFVADPALGFPPGAPAGSPEHASWHSVAHSIAAGVAIDLGLAACFVFARRSVALGQRRWAAFCATAGVVVVALSWWPDQDSISVRLAGAALLLLGWQAAQAARLLAGLPGGTGASEAKIDPTPAT